MLATVPGADASGRAGSKRAGGRQVGGRQVGRRAAGRRAAGGRAGAAVPAAGAPVPADRGPAHVAKLDGSGWSEQSVTWAGGGRSAGPAACLLFKHAEGLF